MQKECFRAKSIPSASQEFLHLLHNSYLWKDVLSQELAMLASFQLYESSQQIHNPLRQHLNV